MRSALPTIMHLPLWTQRIVSVIALGSVIACSSGSSQPDLGSRSNANQSPQAFGSGDCEGPIERTLLNGDSVALSDAELVTIIAAAPNVQAKVIKQNLAICKVSVLDQSKPDRTKLQVTVEYELDDDGANGCTIELTGDNGYQSTLSSTLVGD